MTAPRQDTTGWICENNPFYHAWDASKVRCAGCGHTRTAVEAVESLLASSRTCARYDARWADLPGLNTR